MILVDTSVWIDHLRHSEAELITLLQQNVVLMHPMILGELACGNLQNRTSLVDLLQGLPRIISASNSEALHFITQNRHLVEGSQMIMRLYDLLPS